MVVSPAEPRAKRPRSSSSTGLQHPEVTGASTPAAAAAAAGKGGSVRAGAPGEQLLQRLHVSRSYLCALAVLGLDVGGLVRARLAEL